MKTPNARPGWADQMWVFIKERVMTLLKYALLVIDMMVTAIVMVNLKWIANNCSRSVPLVLIIFDSTMRTSIIIQKKCSEGRYLALVNIVTKQWMAWSGMAILVVLDVAMSCGGATPPPYYLTMILWDHLVLWHHCFCYRLAVSLRMASWCLIILLCLNFDIIIT